MENYWNLADDLREHLYEDHEWVLAASKFVGQTGFKGERMNNFDFMKGSAELRTKDKPGFQNDNNFGFREDNKFECHEDNKFEGFHYNMINLESKLSENINKSFLQKCMYNMNGVYPKSSINSRTPTGSKYGGNIAINKETNNGSSNNSNSNDSNAVDKRFKTLPATETLPRNEVLGGYIFVCNNDTMQEDLKRQLFGLPPRYRDSVRAITPGLPLFLYNYTTHQLHGIFEATSFGGSNIDPTAWEDKKCKGESRFPAQVRIRIRKLCKALEEDAFRPVLHHYDGPKFRLELSVPETLDLLDLCEQAGTSA